MVASALGRCLALAALGEAPTSVDEAVVPVPDQDYLQVTCCLHLSGLEPSCPLAAHCHSCQLAADVLPQSQRHFVALRHALPACQLLCAWTPLSCQEWLPWCEISGLHCILCCSEVRMCRSLPRHVDKGCISTVRRGRWTLQHLRLAAVWLIMMLKLWRKKVKRKSRKKTLSRRIWKTDMNCFTMQSKGCLT